MNGLLIAQLPVENTVAYLANLRLWHGADQLYVSRRLLDWANELHDIDIQAELPFVKPVPPAVRSKALTQAELLLKQ